MGSSKRATRRSQRRNGRLIGFFLLGLLMTLVIGWLIFKSGSENDSRAGVSDADQVVRGQTIYAAQCAQCHGVNLEGQPNWREPLSNGLMPAPPHDANGHTWHHPDEYLFTITRDGGARPGQASGMPAFGQILSDEEIEAVLAYIKSTWPPAIRQQQQNLSVP